MDTTALTENQVLTMLFQVESGLPMTAVCAEHGISSSRLKQVQLSHLNSKRHQLNRLEIAQKAYRMICALGDYDNSVMGVVGEVYAEEVLGMIKAPAGQRGYDGILNGRRLSVKAKKHGAHSDSATYASISDKVAPHVDDILVVFVATDGSIARVIGPVALGLLKGRKERYYVHDIERTIASQTRS